MQRFLRYPFLFLFLSPLLAVPATRLCAQANAGTVSGTVADPTGAVIPGATVELRNPVSGFDRTVQSDGSGNYQFTNVPVNNYHATASLSGFASQSVDLQVRSSIPVTQQFTLAAAQVAQSVTVQTDAGDLLENNSTFHTDLDRKLIDKLPLESSSSSVSSLVTLSTPGVAADSNGLFHGLGDHAENPSPSTARPLLTSRARSSPTRFRWTPFSPSRSFPAHRPLNTAIRPASSSTSPHAPAWVWTSPPAA